MIHFFGQSVSLRACPVARSRSGRREGGALFRLVCGGGLAITAVGFVIGVNVLPGARHARGDDEPKRSDSPRAQVAVAPHESVGSKRAASLAASHPGDNTDAINRAKRMMSDCRAKYDQVHDYSCTFYKRERHNGVLSSTHVMQLKARTNPLSFYVKCVNPRAGREAIWIKGKNSGKVVAHDAGFVKVLAGTMHLDPKGGVAMEDNRHPITEAGLGNMIDTVRHRWDLELKPGMTRVEFHPGMKVGDRGCTMIETTHTLHDGSFIFHRVRLYIDDKLGLPIRLEGYDWPKHFGVEPELVEEYTYANLRINPGLTDRDFDPANPSYSYGRF